MGKALGHARGNLLTVLSNERKARIIIALRAHKCPCLLGVRQQSFLQRVQRAAHCLQEIQALCILCVRLLGFCNLRKQPHDAHLQNGGKIGRKVILIRAKPTLGVCRYDSIRFSDLLLGQLCKQGALAAHDQIVLINIRRRLNQKRTDTVRASACGRGMLFGCIPLRAKIIGTIHPCGAHLHFFFQSFCQ